MRAYSPNKLEILGTAEKTACLCYAQRDSFRRDETGLISYEYNGESKMYWDCTDPDTKINPDTGRPEVLFQDEAGDVWLASKCLLGYLCDHCNEVVPEIVQNGALELCPACNQKEG